MTRRLLIDWNLSPRTGWGNYGIHLTKAALARGYEVVLLAEPKVEGLADDDARALAPAIATWPAVQALYARTPADIGVQLSGIRLRAFGNDFEGSQLPRVIIGDVDVGLVFFESSRFTDAGLARAKGCRVIIAGSSWNTRVLQAAGLTQAVFVMQGVDTRVFHPATTREGRAGRFVVFSGGKLEYRKGQDLVVAAMRQLRRQVPETLLVHAWQNPWPATAGEITRGGHVRAVPPVVDGRLDLAAWLPGEGIPADAQLPVPLVPNTAMAQIVRQADVAIFPNRAEGGTNLVAMECMAAGVPVILSDTTGHRDLIAADRTMAVPCHPLPDAYPGREDWGEPDVEALAAALLAVYRDPAAARARAAKAAGWMLAHDWHRQMAQVLDVIERQALPAGIAAGGGTAGGG